MPALDPHSWGYGNPFFSVYLMSVSLIARRSAQGQKATFSNALTKARFGMKSGSLHKADLPVSTAEQKGTTVAV